jgi:[ribosomal protein S5]-alanine N-acetyltransferase
MRPPSEQLGRIRFPVVHGRVALRSPTLRDVPALVELLRDPAIHRWMQTMPFPYTASRGRNDVEQAQIQRRKRVGLNLVITLCPSGTLIGGLNLHEIDWNHRHATLTYWLGRPYWHQGYGTSALTAACRLGIRDLHLHRLTAWVLHPNEPSRRLLGRLGFREEGRARNVYWREGRWIDTLEYGLLEDEYRSRAVDRRARAPDPPRSRTGSAS